MAAPKELERLVERFDQNIGSYESGAYNEAQARAEFIDPMFELLGWDVQNKAGNAEAYKDVIHEDAIQIGGTTKAPDYCFRIGGARKFFLEAKKPSVAIKDEPNAAYQLRRYAWSAKLPLSLLTDFGELAVYDCRVKPEKSDKPAIGRINYLTFDQYLARWDEISGVFSKEAVLEGSFDRFAVEAKGKRGTAAVDAEFLKEIERWRDMLARGIALRNPGLSVRELNVAVQRTIDRIIFLRICEDRGIETESQWQLRSLQNGTNIYRRLFQLFERADERYNSGLFHFQNEKGFTEAPDTLTPGLVVDDKVLKDIIGNLYYPDSPYEFSVLPADILGQVYEQFLGKVIRLTPGHRAVVEDKPEVKKAGGVYYTPTYIVDYIVGNTVGTLLQGKTPKEAADLKILDPACGSGSFLLGAYQRLLDWHRDWYLNDGPENYTKPRKGGQPALFQGAGAVWRLTTAERKRILLNSIFGVDIDPQAVEVTKLSLLLKVLEGENDQTLQTQLKLFHERALPDLASNIKCGNSLIGPDYFSGRLLPDAEELARVNPFDWKAAFPEAMAAGGFDAVIGNPPYVRMEGFKQLKAYLKAKYACHDERSDLYAYFIERSHMLLRVGARFGMIVSNKFLRANYGKPLREAILRLARIEHVVDLAGLPVFQGATVRTIILLTCRGNSATGPMLYSPPLPVQKFNAVASSLTTLDAAIKDHTTGLEHGDLSGEAWGFSTAGGTTVIQKAIRVSRPLRGYSHQQILRGVVSGLTEAFVVDGPVRDRLVSRNRRAEEILKPFLNGRDIRRYLIEPKGQFLIYTYHGVDISRYPAVEEHLRAFKDRLQKRATRQEWYELQQPQYNFSEFMAGPKIIFPDIATRPRFALDEVGFYSSNTTYFIPGRDLYLLGLLNSRFGELYFKSVCAGLEGKAETYLRFFGQYLEGFPLPTLTETDSADKARHAKMVALVERMLELHKRRQAAGSDHEGELLQRQIDATDHEIDALVYDLYGLTGEEIKIVEAGSDE